MAPTSPLTRLFGRSPIGPLQEHMDKVMECVGELPALVEAALAGDFERVAACRERIAALEDEADDLKHDLRLHLPRSLFLPVDRRDLLEVLTMQDKVANRAKDVAGLILGRRMRIPEPIGARYLDFVRRGVEACAQARRAVAELSELVETGFGGAEIEVMQSMINELDRIEKETDEIQIELRNGLLELESGLPPVDVMFLYRLLDWTGDLADRAQRVGSRLQLILAK